MQIILLLLTNETFIDKVYLILKKPLDLTLCNQLFFVSCFFKTAVQKRFQGFCKSHKKTLAIDFSLKGASYNFTQREVHQSSSLWNLWNVASNFFVEQLSTNGFLSGFALAQPYQSNTYLAQ